MELEAAVKALKGFAGADVAATLSGIEAGLLGASRQSHFEILAAHNATAEALAAARVIKDMASQVNVHMHALGILLSLEHILEDGETVQSLSLGAGNSGKVFDLETNLRVAEFKFIRWRGNADTIRENSLFKDFYGLAESPTPKGKFLYVLDTKWPLKFLNGNRALRSVMSHKVKLWAEFGIRYPELRVVSDYYRLRRNEVNLVDITDILPPSEMPVL